MDLIPIKLSKVGKFLGKGKTKLSKKCYIKLKLKHQLRSSHEENTILVLLHVLLNIQATNSFTQANPVY